jgi:hypothetical protein
MPVYQLKDETRPDGVLHLWLTRRSDEIEVRGRIGDTEQVLLIFRATGHVVSPYFISDRIPLRREGGPTTRLSVSLA